MKIGIDIDDTLVQMHEGFYDFYNKKNKTNFKLVRGKYYLKDFFLISKEEENRMWDEYHDSGDFENVFLMPNAKKVINILKKKHELTFITDRPFQWKDKTLRFIKKVFPNDNFNVIFPKESYGEGASKDKVCRDLGISFIIDDHPIKTIQYAEKGVNVILFNRLWNLEVKGKNIIRVNNWKEVLKVIKKEEKIK